MYFQNRDQAAELLAQELRGYKDQNPLILAIPRGAVPMGKIIAHALGGELDVVLVRKLGAPGQPELAIGAVDETGYVYLTDHARILDVNDTYLADEKEKQLKTLRRRRFQYTQVYPPIDPKNRIVIVVDDGIATGSTMIAALHALQARHPKTLVVATAVAPPSTIRRLETAADEVVCLYSTEDFYAVGQFFEDFSPVSDEEVIELLKREPQKNPRHERSTVS
jgi:predicted phosphoribosyltransferase